MLASSHQYLFQKKYCVSMYQLADEGLAHQTLKSFLSIQTPRWETYRDWNKKCRVSNHHRHVKERSLGYASQSPRAYCTGYEVYGTLTRQTATTSCYGQHARYVYLASSSTQASGMGSHMRGGYCPALTLQKLIDTRIGSREVSGSNEVK